MTQTVAFTRKKNYALASTSATTTQRWPCTRSRALRAAVAHLIEHSSKGNVVWQWIRVTPPTPPPGTGG